MKTWKLTNDNDIELGGSNDINWVSEEDEIAQALKMRLFTNLSEWFLNKNMGLDRSIILRKRPENEWVNEEVTRVILQDERIQRVDYLNVKLFRVERLCTVDFRAILKSGETIEGEVNL